MLPKQERRIKHEKKTTLRQAQGDVETSENKASGAREKIEISGDLRGGKGAREIADSSFPCPYRGEEIAGADAEMEEVSE